MLAVLPSVGMVATVEALRRGPDLRNWAMLVRAPRLVMPGMKVWDESMWWSTTAILSMAWAVSLRGDHTGAQCRWSYDVWGVLYYWFEDASVACVSAILLKYQIQIHQLTPNAIVQLPSTEGFEKRYELHYQPTKIDVDGVEA
jgi:hypothetical protein